MEARSGKDLGLLPAGAAALSPGARYWAMARPRSEEVPGGCSLYARGGQSPLVVLAPEAPVSQSSCFDAAGKLLAWGGPDGLVVVCDIEVVQGRLSQLGVGW